MRRADRERRLQVDRVRDRAAVRPEQEARPAEIELDRRDVLLLRQQPDRAALDLHTARQRAVELVCEHLHERPQVAARGAQRSRRQVEVVLIVGHPGVACARIGHARRLDVPRSRRTVSNPPQADDPRLRQHAATSPERGPLSEAAQVR